MKFLILLAALILERVFTHQQGLRCPHWFAAYDDGIRTRIASLPGVQGPLGVLLVLMPLIAAVALLQHLFAEFLYGVLSLPFGLLVLLYCLGPRDLDRDVESYVNASSTGNEDGAKEAAADILGYHTEQVPEARSRSVAEAILVQGLERTFGVLFWFVLLGPLGAALYRAAQLLQQRHRSLDGANVGFVAAARYLHKILGWVPARLLAITYALSGSFEDAMQRWREVSTEDAGLYADSNTAALISSGSGALRLDDYVLETDEFAAAPAHLSLVRSALALMWRAVVIWVALAALLTLAGWAG